MALFSIQKSRLYQFLLKSFCLSSHFIYPFQHLGSIFNLFNKNIIALPIGLVEFSETNLQIYLSTYDPHFCISSVNRYYNFAQHAFENKILPNENFLPPTSIISSHIHLGKPTKAFASFLELTRSKNNIDPSVSNSLLALLSSNGYIDFAKTVLSIMISKKISLNTVGLGVFMGALSRETNLDNILLILDEIKQQLEGIHNSVIAFSIIDGLCRGSKVNNASSALEELRVRNFKPDFIAYRVVIEGFRSMGRIDEVEKLKKQKRKLGVAPWMHEYKEYIFDLISARCVREAKELGEAIVDGKFPVEDDFLNVLVGVVSEVEPDTAISFCRYMIKMEKFPNLSTLRNFSINLCRNDKKDEMWDVFQSLLSLNYFSDLESYNVMVWSLCNAGKVREAYTILKEMRKRGISPNIFSYNCLMEACCRDDLLRPAKKLWDEMFVNGCHGNLQTYNILIQKFSDTGEVGEAQRLFYRMLEKGVKPNTSIYTSLIKGLCREANFNDAIDIFNKSMEQDVVTAGSVLNALIFSLCKKGNFCVASKVLCGLLPSYIDDTNSHIVLLKSLANAGELETAIAHGECIRDTSPKKLAAISAELFASLSSALNSQPVLRLLQAMREKGLVSKSDPWFHLCEESFSWCKSEK